MEKVAGSDPYTVRTVVAIRFSCNRSRRSLVSTGAITLVVDVDLAGPSSNLAQ
jgi:hypothetical protein